MARKNIFQEILSDQGLYRWYEATAPGLDPGQVHSQELIVNVVPTDIDQHNAVLTDLFVDLSNVS
ncbi:MAG: hypothetical protein ABEI52_04500 [Halobacteriaceae archaeon]